MYCKDSTRVYNIVISAVFISKCTLNVVIITGIKTAVQWSNVPKYIYSSTVFKYNFEVL